MFKVSSFFLLQEAHNLTSYDYAKDDLYIDASKTDRLFYK